MKTLNPLFERYLESGTEASLTAFYGKLFDLFFKKVYAIAYSRYRAYAEDIASEVFLKLMNIEPEKFSGRLEEIEGFIVRTTYNLSTDYLRKYNNKERQTFQWIDNHDSLHTSYDPVGQRELSLSFENALSVLSERQRKAFCLSRQGYSYREIAEKMRSKTTTVRSLLQHARNKLREQSEEFLSFS